MRLRTFGGLGLDSASRDLGGAASQRRPLAILLLLAAAGDHGISRDKLVSYLWPEKDAEHARNALRQTIYSLRRDLGAPDLVLGGNELRLNRGLLPSDLAEFDDAAAHGDLERVVELYTGPLADGFFLTGAVDFEHWLDEQRRQRARQFASAVEALAGDASKRGDHTRAAALWRRLAAQDPLDSRVALRLIEALASVGDRTGALQHARLHISMLREELGVPPDEAILKAVERLRTPPGGTPAFTGDPPPTAETRVEAPLPPESTDAPAAMIPGDAESRPVVGTRRSWRRPVTAALFFLTVTAVVAFVTARVLRPDLQAMRRDRVALAVAPFEVLDPQLAPWREGMMNVLSHKLDEATALRAIAPSEVMRHWGGHSGTASARQLARDTEARLVVFGFLFRSGGDSVRAEASLLDIKSRRISRTMRYESITRQDRLADSLTAFVVATLRDWMPHVVRPIR